MSEHNDLLLSVAEAGKEREAIMADSGITDPDALRADLHRCEVASIIRRYYPRGEEAAEYLALVEKRRGKEAADKLRALWKLKEMDYKKIHDAIISNAIDRTCFDGYFERHHVIPKSMGGSDNKSNIVKLTAREHYLIH